MSYQTGNGDYVFPIRNFDDITCSSVSVIIHSSSFSLIWPLLQRTASCNQASSVGVGSVIADSKFCLLDPLSDTVRHTLSTHYGVGTGISHVSCKLSHGLCISGRCR